jgi:hypothetical protein
MTTESFSSFYKLQVLSALLICICFISCSTEEVPDTETFVYSVNHNGGTEQLGLTVTDFGDGSGFMETPPFVTDLGARYDLVIDRVSSERANFVTEDIDDSMVNLSGVGFFTLDSVYVEFTVEGFTNVDIFSGVR